MTRKSSEDRGAETLRGPILVLLVGLAVMVGAGLYARETTGLSPRMNSGLLVMGLTALGAAAIALRSAPALGRIDRVLLVFIALAGMGALATIDYTSLRVLLGGVSTVAAVTIVSALRKLIRKGD